MDMGVDLDMEEGRGHGRGITQPERLTPEEREGQNQAEAQRAQSWPEGPQTSRGPTGL